MSGRFSTAPHLATRHRTRVPGVSCVFLGKGHWVCVSHSCTYPGRTRRVNSVKSRGRGRSKVLIGATVRVVDSTTPYSSELLGPHVLASVQLQRQDAHPAHRQRRAQVEVRAAVAEHAHRVGAALLRC